MCLATVNQVLLCWLSGAIGGWLACRWSPHLDTTTDTGEWCSSTLLSQPDNKDQSVCSSTRYQRQHQRSPPLLPILATVAPQHKLKFQHHTSIRFRHNAYLNQTVHFTRHDQAGQKSEITAAVTHPIRLANYRPSRSGHTIN